jgi:hypothetical protein
VFEGLGKVGVGDCMLRADCVGGLGKGGSWGNFRHLLTYIDDESEGKKI